MNDSLLAPAAVADLAWRIDARTVLTAVPGLDQSMLREVRQEFARWALGSRRGWPTWQDAWNAWAATGWVSIRRPRCAECHGKRFGVRSYGRTGSMVCHRCHGTGRGGVERFRVRPVPVPTPPQMLDNT
jgi:hypothetical protein